MKRIGIDVGGTFTDLILVDEDAGLITVEKVPSTPDDPSRAVVSGVEKICAQSGIEVKDLDLLLHGTTVATNIALEHNGADVGMITTEGFRDILHIGRHKKPLNFSLQQPLPWQSQPLVKRRHRMTVKERLTAPDGDTLVPLDKNEVRQKVRALREAGVESIAVGLLHSYINSSHERIIKEIIEEEYPEAFVSLSSEVIPLYREYERFSTTALNAYIGPKVSKYLHRFVDAMKTAGFGRHVQLMQSSGGMTTADAAAAKPVNLMMSGPVGGLIGGIWAGKMAGFDNVFTLDIGGTSADIGVAVKGQLRMKHLLDNKVGEYQAMIPMVDIDAIGHGGGSIAFVDGGNVFRVGPQSAGAYPGPACYGRGGDKPTSTDAQVILGRLRPNRGLIGGGMTLDVGLANKAMKTIADQMSISNEEAAIGTLQIQKFEMVQAIELNSVRRGYDPRDFTLVAAGGAGPLFSAEIAIELEVPKVLVPPHPGILSATGLLATDMKYDYMATERQHLAAPDRVKLQQRFEGLEADAVAQLNEDGFEVSQQLILREADCRYVGQGYEVKCQVPPGEITADWVEQTKQAFVRAHKEEYGHTFDSEVEIINLRVTGIGRIPPLEWMEAERGGELVSDALIEERDVVFDHCGEIQSLKTPFYDRGKLKCGNKIAGPAIIEQYDTTTVVPPLCDVAVDTYGNLIVDCEEAIKANKASSSQLSTPILMRVIGGTFQAIAKEMAGVMFRTSYSSIIRESEDLGAGIFDKHGNQLAEADSTPMFMGAMPKIVKNVIKLLGDDLHEGDVILHNDPYHGATHSPDCCIVTPIFWEGELAGFTGASAHLLDIGGAFPGINITSSDIFAEGNIYRAVKVVEKGVPQDQVWSHILDNVRTASYNKGDLNAMIAACELAERRFIELTRRYGLEAVYQAANFWMDYSEAMLRSEISKLPDGEYETETGYLDDDGVNRGKPLPVKVKVIKKGDNIKFDLTGSSDEVMTAYNAPFEGTTCSAMAFITRMIFLDEYSYPVFVPQNEGMARPIEVYAPKGSIFNPNFPRSCSARFCQVQRAVDLVLRALAPVVPEKITAGNSAHLQFVSYSGFVEERGEYWVYLEVNEGSYGGRKNSDGLDSVDSLIANTRNNPIEELEWTYPMRTERYELRDEPCAAGRTRGGVGIVRVNRMLEDTTISCEGDRHVSDPPWGIFGGEGGLNASMTKNPGTAGEEALPAKFAGVELKAGDALQIVVPSSGGFGDPLEREPELVLSDVKDGFTTAQLAEETYGVVINTANNTVDQSATTALRKKMVP